MKKIRIFLILIAVLTAIKSLHSQTDTSFSNQYDNEMKEFENNHNKNKSILEQEYKDAYIRYNKRFNKYVNNLEDEYNYFIKEGKLEAVEIVKGDIQYENQLREAVVIDKNIEEKIKKDNNKKRNIPINNRLSIIPNGLPFKVKNIRISSQFSTDRYHPILKRRRPHWGVDYACPIGTKLYSTADGQIIVAKKSKSYGNYIVVKHGDYTTTYAHLSKIIIKKGDKVKKGDIIGLSGSTGISTGPHLHYEIRNNGTPVDPKYFI